jgi:hypothetical protein
MANATLIVTSPPINIMPPPIFASIVDRAAPKNNNIHLDSPLNTKTSGLIGIIRLVDQAIFYASDCILQLATTAFLG